MSTWAIQMVLDGQRCRFFQAKRTLGFLYAYGDDPFTLGRNDCAECRYRTSLQKEVNLLLGAALEGDEDAKRLLQTLNEAPLK